ncbi:hypothetical protein [Streptodolium elevatio]
MDDTGDFMVDTNRQQDPPDLMTWLRTQGYPPGMARRVQRLRHDLQAIADRRAENLNAVSTARAEQLATLRHLDLGAEIRIRPAVVAAARILALPSTWSVQLRAYFVLYEGLYVVPGFVLFGLVFAGVVPGLPIPTGSAAAGAMFLMVAITWYVTKLIGHAAGRLGTYGSAIAKLVIFAGLLTANLLLDRWFPMVVDKLNDSDVAGWGRGDTVVADLQFDIGIPWALATAAAIAGLKLLYAAVHVALERAAPREADDVVQCAAVLTGFLDIALLLEGLHIPDEDLVPAPVPRPRAVAEATELADNPERVPPPYITTEQRLELLRRLEHLADTVEGPWRRALRTGDAAADHEINRTADGIATAIRRWKTTAALGGRDLELMREKFTAAVVNAADGEWTLLAADDITARERFGQRLRRRIQAVIATGLIVASLFIVIAKPFGLSSGAAVIVSAMLAYLGNLAAPRATDRLMTATRLVGFTPPGSGGGDKSPAP